MSTITLADGVEIPDDPTYEDLVRSLGVEIVLGEDDDDWRGDTRLLLRADDRWGLLTFGWGSCSGCDALQDAQGDVAELTSLRESLGHSIVWRDSTTELLAYVNGKDWRLDHSYSDTFLGRVRVALEAQT